MGETISASSSFSCHRRIHRVYLLGHLIVGVGQSMKKLNPKNMKRLSPATYSFIMNRIFSEAKFEKRPLCQENFERGEDAYRHMEYLKDLKRAHRTSVILYIAFMASLGIYVAVVEILRTELGDYQGMLEGDRFYWVRYAFYGIGLAQIFIIRLVREILTKGLASTEAEELIAHLSRLSILTAAFCESVAIFGLVLFFLSGNQKDFYVLVAISIVLFIVYFPKYSNWEDWFTSRIRR